MMLLPGLQYLYVYNDGRFVEPGYPCMFHVEHGPDALTLDHINAKNHRLHYREKS